jgi:TP901 family phage tail tape measure protein
MAQAERSVSVVLKADINDYVTKMGVASKATKDFATTTGRTASSAATSTKQLGASAAQVSGDLDKAAKSTKGFGDAAGKASGDVDKVSKSTKSTSDSAKTLGTGMAVAGAALAAGIGLAVKAFADFDKQMSEVRAVSGATASEMNQLTEAALAAGAATQFSASDAAAAEAELVKAGISVKDVLGGALTGTLDLAAAGSLGLAEAATVAANAMNIFSLQGDDVGHIADVLAAGANKSATDVDKLGQALEQSGLVAAQMGLSLEETTGLLAAFADNGLKGSDAGTSLKTMLQRLVPSSVAAANAMKDIHFSAFDASGAMKDFDVIAGDLQAGLSTLNDKQKASTLSTIFGSDAVRAANVVFKLGKRGVDEYTKAVNDQGAAADVAKEKMNNLAGDMENLRGSFETALIKGGSGANDALRGLAQAATTAVNAFSDLPDSVQQGAIGIAAVASGALLLGGGLITVIPKIIATKEALDALTAASPRAAGALGAVGKAGVIVGIAAAGEEVKNLAAAATVAQPPVDQLAKGLSDLADNAQESADFATIFNRGVGIFSKDFKNASDALDDFGANARIALDPSVLEQYFGNAGQAEAVFNARIGQLDKALAKLVTEGKADQAAAAVARLETAAQKSGLAAGRVSDELTGYKAAVGSAAVANGEFADSTGKLGGAASGAAGSGKLLGDEIKDQQQAAEDAKKAYDDLTNAVKNYGDQVAAALSATSGYEAAIDKAAEVAKKRKEIQDQINALQQGGATSDPKAAANAKAVAAEVEAANKKADLADATTRRNADAAAAAAKTQAERDRIRANEAATLEKSQIDRQQRAAKLADAQGKTTGTAKDNTAEIARLKEQLQQYTATLDLSTEAGRANTAMLLDIAESAKNAAVENFKNGTSVQDVQAKMAAARQTFIDQAIAFGDTEAHAKALADQLGLTKQNVDNLAGASATVTVNADTAAANSGLTATDGLLDMINGRLVVATVQVKIDDKPISAEAIAGLADGSLGFKGFATGGYTGDGGKFEPKGVVHGGEFVFTKEETSKAGVVNLAALARSLRGYAGGPVGPQFADRGLVSSAMTTNNITAATVTNDNRINIENVNGPTSPRSNVTLTGVRRLHALGRRGAR